MHKRMLLLGIVFLLPLAMFAEWTVDCITISITADAFTDATLEFGVADGATDLFDSDFDASHPPCPPSGPCVYFPSDDPLVTLLSRDIRGTIADGDSLIWTIMISGSMNPGTISWTSCLPADGDFHVTSSYPGVPPVSWTDMRVESSYDYMPAQQIKIKYIAGGGTEPEDLEAPEVTDMDPADGSMDVSPTATINFSIVDRGDAPTGVDGSSVTVSIDGVSVPDPISYATEITNGYAFSVDPLLGGEWPAGSHSILINACDNADPVNCMEEFEYNFEILDEPVPYLISGTCEIEGMDDYSGVVVMGEPGLGTVTTGADGTYEFMPTTSGTYTIRATYTGYTASPASHEVSLTDMEYESTGNDFMFTEEMPDEYMLYGMVMNMEGDAIEGAEVMAGAYGSATTGASGTYEISGIPAGMEFELTATAAGYEDFSEMMTLTDDTEYDIEMTMTSYMVSGTFTLEGETDYTGITVEMAGDATMSTTTASDGSYSFADVMPGSYSIEASMTGFESYMESFDVEDMDVEISGELMIEEPTALGVPAHVGASQGYIDFIYVTWEEPLAEGLVELGYDDGTPESTPGGYTHIGVGGDPSVEWGVQFTPPGDGYNLVSVSYDFLIEGGESTFELNIRDMVADTPADNLIPAYYATIDSADEWSVYDIDLDLTDDDFYVGFSDVVLGADTNRIYIGCDKSDPDLRSWINWDGWDLVNNMTFDGLPETDLMIRALVRAPEGLLLELEPAPVRGGRISAGATEQVSYSDPSLQKAVTIAINDENPFIMGDEFVASDMFTRTNTPSARAPLYRDMESMELTGYKIYRSDAPFADTTDAEYLATRPADSLFYFDTSVIDVAEPFEWMWYSVVAVYDEGNSDMAMPDSGFYVDLRDTTADVLIVDFSAGFDYAEEGTMNEAEWYEEELTAMGVDVVRTEDGEGIYRTAIGYYDAIIAVWGVTDGGRITPSGDEMEAFTEYVDAGGNLYFEGPIVSLMTWGSPTGDMIEDLFGYEQAFEDTIWGHPSDEGNVLWLESTEDWWGFYWTMDYEPFTNADWRNAQYMAGSGATEVWQSQPDGEMGVVVEWSRSRAIYKDHAAPAGKTMISSVYLGACHDDEGESTRTSVLEHLMAGLGVPIAGVDEDFDLIPSDVQLGANTPNPFNGATEIPFEIFRTGNVEVSVFDIEGRRVSTLFDGTLNPGHHKVTWNGTDDEGQPVTSGVYLYSVTANGDQMAKTMLYVR